MAPIQGLLDLAGIILVGWIMQLVFQAHSERSASSILHTNFGQMSFNFGNVNYLKCLEWFLTTLKLPLKTFIL